jgi:3-hydroxyacyl-CoA dehydrogenase
VENVIVLGRLDEVMKPGALLYTPPISRVSTSAMTAASGVRRKIPSYRKMPIADAIVEAGRLGQKTGAGWFRYEKGDRTPQPDPEVARIIKMGGEQRSFTDEEILRRLLFASVNGRARSSRRARPTAPATST